MTYRPKVYNINYNRKFVLAEKERYNFGKKGKGTFLIENVLAL